MELLSRKRRSGGLSLITEIAPFCSAFWSPYLLWGVVALSCHMEVHLRVLSTQDMFFGRYPILTKISEGPKIGSQGLGYLQAYGKGVCTCRDFNVLGVPVKLPVKHFYCGCKTEPCTCLLNPSETSYSYNSVFAIIAMPSDVVLSAIY